MDRKPELTVHLAEKYGFEIPIQRKYFTQSQKKVINTVLDDCWTYMVDHAKIEKNGNICIRFEVRDKIDFLAKVRTRIYTDYCRVNTYAVEREANLTAKEWKKLPLHKRWYLDLLYKIRNYCNKKLLKIQYPYIEKDEKRISI